MNQNDAEHRITDLETKIAHMDSMINDLSDMVKSQWDRIDILERQNKLMSDDVKRMGDFMRTSSEDDVPPPHY